MWVNPFSKSRRTQTIDAPEPVSPITGRPYGPQPAARDEAAEAASAAGQAALATAKYTGPVRGGYRPQDMWRGVN